MTTAMAVSNLQVLDIIEVMEAFLERKRPPEHIRPKLDIGYRIEGQSVIIHSIRPVWNDASRMQHSDVAKTVQPGLAIFQNPSGDNEIPRG